MRSATISAILVLALAQMVCAAQTLTVNGEALDAITLKTGRACMVEVVSDNSNPYHAYVGFDDRIVLGSFDKELAMPEAGDLANITEYDVPAFYGYSFSAAGTSPPPSPGVHFVIEYEPQQVGETELKLYDTTRTIVIATVHITVVSAQMGTAFTYQGRLMDANSAADGLYDFGFMLFDDPCAGNQQGGTIDVNDLDVIEGYFTVELDFGSSVFNGEGRWLETTVAQGDGNDPCTLWPRIEITAVPYALQTRGIFVDNGGNVGIGTENPQGKLHVNGKVVAGQVFVNDDTAISAVHGSGGSSGYAIKAFALPGAKYAGHFDAPFSGGVGLYAAGADYAAYFSGRGYFSGNVGIGMEQPQKLLHIRNKDGGYNGLGICLDPHGGGYEGGTTWEIDNNNGNLELTESRALPEYPKTRLTISNGSVGIGTTNPSGLLEVTTRTSFSPATLDQSQTSGGSYATNREDCWQSFTAGIGGKLDHVDMYFSTVSCGSEILRIYSGEGTGGSLLYTGTISAPAYTWVSHTPITTIVVTQGTKYTIRLTTSTCDGTNWGSASNNPYSGGRADILSEYDYMFRTYVSTAVPEFLISSDGNVGIGTTSPAGKLDVNGSIYQRGTVLHADYVFEPDYELESIEEHSEYMWNEKHLPGIPKAEVDDNGREIIEVGAHRRGIVEELEKAHIYIEQLQKQNQLLEARLAKLEAVLSAL